MQKPAGQFNHCLADYVAPNSADYLGGFAVTIHGSDEISEKFKTAHDDYSAIITKALADRLAEAFAEYLHLQARIAWGFGGDENLSNADLIRDRKSTRLNSSHSQISYAAFCLKKKTSSEPFKRSK